MGAAGAMTDFLQEDEGQDLIEYTLILGTIVLAGAAAYLGMSVSISTLWTIANSRLAAANQSSS
jgi:Flp pilus assembly pilin Flp